MHIFNLYRRRGGAGGGPFVPLLPDLVLADEVELGGAGGAGGAGGGGPGF